MLHLVIVTRNRSIYVKTLHMLLGIQGMCAQVGLPIDLTFVKDANKDKMEIMKKKMKSADRLVWVEYGVSCDREHLKNFIQKFEGFDALVMPVVKEGIDWDMFKKKVKVGSTEPSHQKGLTFDTEVSNKVLNKEEDFYGVTSTDPSLWSMDPKNVLKKLKDKKSNGPGLVLPPTMTDFFKLCIKKNVKVCASVGARTFNHFTHECVGNIMNMTGLKVSK